MVLQAPGRGKGSREKYMGRRFANILETVGNTPVVRINQLAPDGVNLYVKIEAFNPLGSVKDRLALGVIEAAERRGELKPGQTVIEATSGNTGIGLAMVCAAKGYPLVVTMAESFSVERRKLMRFLGAKVVLTPAARARHRHGQEGASSWPRRTAGSCTRQFENEANADIHSRTTAREIIDDFAGEQLDYWVTGYGTGGTLKGVARVLAKERPETKIVVCEPADAPLLEQRHGAGAQPRRLAGGAPSGVGSRIRCRAGRPDFIPKLTGDAVDMKADRPASSRSPAPRRMRCSRELAQKEGIFVGITAGGDLRRGAAGLRRSAEGRDHPCMLPDTGERYLSTPLFADIPADMTEEEMKISRSTPGCRCRRRPDRVIVMAGPGAGHPRLSHLLRTDLDYRGQARS